MKKNMRGFTLIELLAVIVILAIIALIATPIIMNVINDAKEGADRDGAYGVVKSIETAVAQEMVSRTDVVITDCTVTIDKSTITCGEFKADLKGTKPSDADIKFVTKGASKTGEVADGTVIKMGSGWFKLDGGKFGKPTKDKPTA